MNRIYRIIGMLLVSTLFFQCQKDLNYIGGPDAGAPVVIPAEPIKANLQGNVYDENDQPAPGVSITAGNIGAVTNESGYFRINGASLDKNTSLITAEKTGYFKGYRVFAATDGTNQVFIKLIKKTLVATISAPSGGSATLFNGAKIALPANGVVIASSGDTYSGDVSLYASYINPRAADIGQTVPGSFSAIDKTGKRVVLASYGMLAIDLESSTGEKLQIKPGAVATLTCPISTTMLPSAPVNIPLWYVDEQTGLWKEEGIAAKQGNNYIGDVKHFSYWNYDLPYDAVSLSATLHNSKGAPLANVSVKITCSGSDSTVSSAHGCTDSVGQVKGLVPSGKNLLLQVLDPCNSIVYSQNIPALNENTNLGIVIVADANTSLLTLTGILVNCNNSPVMDGYAIISYNNTLRYAATDATGKFSTTFVTCTAIAATARVIGVDKSEQSKAVTVNITAPVTNAGTITACGTSSVQFINYKLDGVDYTITSTGNDSLVAYSLDQGAAKSVYINGSVIATNNVLTFDAKASSTGTFAVDNLFVGDHNGISLTPPFNVTFTGYANGAGEFYEGTLLGQFTADSSTIVHNISASFRVMRIF